MNWLVDAMYWCLFGQSVSLAVISFIEYRKWRKYAASARDKQILLSSDLHKLKGEQIGLVKTMCRDSQKYQAQLEIGSNQVYYNMLPLDIFYSKVNYLMNSRVQYKIHPRLLWRDQEKRVMAMPVVVNPDLLNYQLKYQSVFQGKDAPGDLQTIWKYFLAFLSGFFELFFFALQPKAPYPAIKGPHWGTLKITASLLLNAPFILCFDLKDGKILPQVAGFTREQVASYFQSRQTGSFLAFGLAIVAFYIVSHKTIVPLWRKIKWRMVEWWREFREKRQRKKVPKNFNPDVEENLLCIICYNRCKNIVFKKCKHMIVCDKCVKNPVNPITQCPYCREKVDDFIELMEYEEEERLGV